MGAGSTRRLVVLRRRLERLLTRKGSAVTTVLDIIGAGLIIAAAAVAFGLGAALLAGGAVCLAASWSLSRGGSS